MPKLRLVIASLLIVVVALALPLAASAQLPPALSICTVYVDGELAGAGVTVAAFVGDETTARAEAETNASGVATVMVGVQGGDLTDPVTDMSYTVDGVAATETPNVGVSLSPNYVRLDVTTFAPLDYDIDEDGVLSKTEALEAVSDYFDETITLDQVLEVVILYFS